MTEIPPDEPTQPSVRDPSVEPPAQPKLQLITQKPWPELVEMLKWLVTAAENGELQQFVYAWEKTDGETGFHAYHGSGSYPLKMIGKVEVLKLAMIQRYEATET